MPLNLEELMNKQMGKTNGGGGGAVGVGQEGGTMGKCRKQWSKCLVRNGMAYGHVEEVVVLSQSGTVVNAAGCSNGLEGITAVLQRNQVAMCNKQELSAW